MSQLTRAKEGAIAVVLICLFIGISLATITRFSTWHDESYSATLIEGSYADTIRRTALDVHPPFFYIVLKTWSLAFGNSVFNLRLLSLVCMSGAIIIAWRLLRRQFGSRMGLYALAGMATGPFLIRYSQEMRMYALGALLAMASTYLLWRMLYDNLAKFTLRAFSIAYILLITAALYTQYFLVFLLVAHAFLAIAKYYDRASFNLRYLAKVIWRLPKRWWTCFILPVVFMLPWVPTAKVQFHQTHGAFWIGPLSVDNVTSTPINLLIFKVSSEVRSWLTFLAMAALISLVLLVLYWLLSSGGSDKKRAAKRFTAALLLIPWLLVILISMPPFQPAYQDRYLAFYAPIFYGVLALAMVYWLSRQKGFLKRLPVFVIIASLIYGLVSVSLVGNSEGWQPQVDYAHFNINRLNAYMEKNSPNTEVVSSTLWTFLDAHIVVGKRITTRLYAPHGVGKYGNGSAVYDRYDLQIKNLHSLKGPYVWVLEESGLPSTKVPTSWHEITRDQEGYARVILYQIN